MSNRKFVKTVRADQTSKRAGAAYDKLKAARAGVRTHNRNFVPRMQSIAEKKNIDTAVAIPAFGIASGALTLLNGCQAAVVPTGRVGRRITMTSLLIRGYVQLAATTTGASPFRLLVVYDSQANKQAPAVTDVLTGNAFSYPMLLANSRRFKIVMDKQYPVFGTAGPQGFELNEYVKLNLDAEYIDGTGAGDITDITSGSLYAITFTSAGLGVATATNNIQARVRFLDI